MPTYEFRCPNGHEFDKFYKTMSTAPREVPCPECGAVAARQLSGGGGLVFKGSGFYLTDYGKNAHRGGAPGKTGEGGKTESAKGGGEGGKAEGGKAEGGKGEAGKTEGGGGKSEGAKADSGSKSESKSDTAKRTAQSPQPKSEKPSKPESE